MGLGLGKADGTADWALLGDAAFVARPHVGAGVTKAALNAAWLADALTAAVDTIPTDPACMPNDASPARVRVVVTHYDPLDTPIAATAWGWLYAADCVDPGSLRQFYAEHAGMAPEDFCADGYYP